MPADRHGKSPLHHDRIGLAIVATAALAILLMLGIGYWPRLFSPLPLYAWDEAGYLNIAIHGHEAMARNPFAVGHGNSVYLALVRVVGDMSPAYVVWLRVVNLAAYVAGIVLAFLACAPRPRRRHLGCLLLALCFPYYRFVVSDLPEGVYVGVLGAIVYATRWLFAAPPWGVLPAAALAAALALVKPHGVAVAAGLAATLCLGLAGNGSRSAAVARLLVFAVGFFLAGNLLRLATAGDTGNPFAFFVGGFYDWALRRPLEWRDWQLASISSLANVSTVLLFAGIPVTVGLTAAWQAFRRRPAAVLVTPHVAFAVLALSLVATLGMVAIFAAKVARNPDEILRLWGRYFEFYVPLLWLAAIVHFGSDTAWTARTRLAAAAVTSLGLAGLLLSFALGITLFPWDATATTAFFSPDPVRAPLQDALPSLAIAIASTLVAIALLLRGGDVRVLGALFLVVIAALSIRNDVLWMDPALAQRRALATDLHAARELVATRPGLALLLARDANDGQLSFWVLGDRVDMAASAERAAQPLSRYATVVTIGDITMPLPGWSRLYAGSAASVYGRE